MASEDPEEEQDSGLQVLAAGLGVEQGYRVTSSSDIEVDDSAFISSSMFHELQDAGVVTHYDLDDHQISSVEIDFSRLSEIVHEHETLSTVASSVEYEILDFYRGSSGTTFTTSEISEAIDRPKSSVSRSLGELVEKGLLEKVQQGVYRRS